MKYTIEFVTGTKLTDVEEGTELEVARVCHYSHCPIPSYTERVERLNSNMMIPLFERTTWYPIKQVIPQGNVFEDRMDKPIEIIIRGGKCTGKTTLMAVIASCLNNWYDGVKVDLPKQPQGGVYSYYRGVYSGVNKRINDGDAPLEDLRSGQIVLKEETVE